MSVNVAQLPAAGWRGVRHEIARLTDTLGGRARRTAVLLLASVLGLGTADTGTVGALAPKLERALHIGNLDLGLLVTVSALTGALGMLPAGVMADRRRRVTMLVVAIILWAVAEGMSAAAVSFLMLLLIRLALGALTAVTGPTVASLTGDLFPAAERSRIYGFILTGELLGAGFGLLVAGLVAEWANWRVAFLVMALPSLVLAWALHRWLPEPARGGQSRLEVGAEEIRGADDVEPGDPDEPAQAGQAGQAAAAANRDPAVQQLVRRQRIKPAAGAVIERDPLELGWSQAARFVLRVRSNVIMIVASALGYFFLSGLETFALIYLEGHFGVNEGEATLMVLVVGAAAVLGAVIGGRMSDGLLRRGRIDGRLVIPGVGFILTAVFFAPGIFSASIAISLPLFVLAGFWMAAPNPGLDAARLDIMPSGLWGRAESVRSLLRSILQAFAPLLFGFTSVLFGGKSQGFAASASSSSTSTTVAHSAGLEPTFLLMLTPLVLAGVVVLWGGRRFYGADVAAASESEERFPPHRVDERTPGETAKPLAKAG